MLETFVITAKAENVLRVLQKLTSLMTRKRLKVQEMKVRESIVAGESLLILTLQADTDLVNWLMNQLGKFVDLFDLELQSISFAPQLKHIKNQEWKELRARSRVLY